MARSVVLGAAGFIGYHLSRRLVNEGDQVTLVDNLMRGEYDADFQALLEAPNASFIKADLTDAKAYDQLDGEYDEVYLLASMIGVSNVQNAPHEVMRVNTSIIYNTLSWMQHHAPQVGKLLFTSTSEVYAGGVDLGHVPVPTSESVPLTIRDISNPRFSYAITKLWGEACCLHYATAYGFEVTIVRYHNIYGPRMGFSHVIPEVSMRVLNRQNPLVVYGTEQTRAFCFVSDAVEATVATMRTQSTNGEILHIGNSTEEITIAALSEKLLYIAGLQVPLDAKPAPPGAVSRRCPDTSKLHKLTGFEPSVPLDKGLKETFMWYAGTPRR